MEDLTLMGFMNENIINQSCSWLVNQRENAMN
jgi:hypothetical protein